MHGTRIGTLVGLKGGDEVLARELAMHVAAVNPQYVKPSDVPAEVVVKEREILVAQAASEGKPPAIVEKMVEGRLRKYLAEICLTGQPFVKDPDTTVEKLLANVGRRSIQIFSVALVPRRDLDREHLHVSPQSRSINRACL